MNYTSLEPYPISDKIYNKLNFYKLLKSDKKTFIKLHNSDWEENVPFKENFNLNKLRKKYNILIVLKNLTLFTLMHLLLKNNQKCGPRRS